MILLRNAIFSIVNGGHLGKWPPPWIFMWLAIFIKRAIHRECATVCVNFGASFQKRTIFLKFAVIRNRYHPVLTHWSYTTFALTHQRRYTRYCPRLIFKLLWTKHRNINTPKPDTDHSGYALCQWETTLLCNVVSHWLSVYPYLVEPIPHVLGLLWLVLFNDNFRILIWISHNFVLRCHFTISQCYLMAWRRTICCLNQILSRSPMGICVTGLSEFTHERNTQLGTSELGLSIGGIWWNPADVNSNNISWNRTCILTNFTMLVKIFHEIYSVINHGGFRLLARIVRQSIKKWRYINITPGRWYIHVLCVIAWLTGLEVKDGLFLSPLCSCVGDHSTIQRLWLDQVITNHCCGFIVGVCRVWMFVYLASGYVRATDMS